MRWHLPPAGVGIVLGADGGQQHVERRHPELQAERAVAVVGTEPVVARSERQTGGDQDRFVAGTADLKEDLTLAFELDLLVIELSRQEHAAVDREELRGREPAELDAALHVAAVDRRCLHPVMSNRLIIDVRRRPPLARSAATYNRRS